MSDSSSGGGVSLCTVVFIVFLILKLVGVITWSWWWVTAPLWIPVLLWIAVFGSILTIGIIVAAIGASTKQ